MLSNFAVTSIANSGAGSLRNALTASNSATGQTNTISFNIAGSGVQKIALLSALPTITNPVVIDATTINGFANTPLIELDGTNAKAGSTGLMIAASATGTVVKGLNVHSFGGDGIDILASHVVLSANSIGTGPSGVSAAPNHGSGVVVRGSNDTIGGVNVFKPDGTFQVMGGNLISGNAGNGVVLAGGGNLVEGNWIGVDSTGKSALGNSHDGVVIDGVSSNTVGGTTAGTRNVISGNLGQGVSVANVAAPPPTSYSTSAGPLTLTPAGISAGFSLSNFATNFPSLNTIGPLGNAFLSSGGVLVSSFTNAVYDFPTDTDGQIATAVPKVSYSYKTIDLAQINSHIYMDTRSPAGVSEVDSSGKVIQSIAAIPITTLGMAVDTTPGAMFDHLLVIGGTTGSNLTSIYDVDPVAKTTKLVADLPRAGDGDVFDPDSNTLYIAFNGYGLLGYNMSTKQKVFDSGQLPSAYDTADGISIGGGDLRNELLVNTNQGAIVEVSTTSPSTNTVIASGGTRGDFATVDPNNGTFLLSQTDRVVRLTPPLGSGLKGGPTTTTTGNVVEGNLIGLGADGTTLLGNGSNGVMIASGAAGNTIGGTLAGQRNTIAANKGNGVALFDPKTSTNAVLGNSIGTDVSGAVVAGNLGDGVWLGSSVSGDRVAGNTIANNAMDGVGLDSTTSGTTVQANRIYGNKGLGINSGSGSTSGQSYPVLSAAFGSANASYVIGTAAGASGTVLTIDFYANTTKDPSGYGQGQFYLGSTTVNAGSSFHVLLPVGATPGEWVSATTTSATGDTSGFAADVVVVKPVTLAMLASSASTSTYGQGVDFTATITSTPFATGTVQFQVDGVNFGQPVAIDPATGVATSPSIASLYTGSHTVTAIYTGDSLHDGLTTTFTQSVNQDTTTTVTGPATFAPVRGQALTVYAVVSAKAPGSGTPTGTVTFKYGSTVLATAPLVPSGGQAFARWTSAPLEMGTYTISTVYNGDIDDLGSTSSTTFTVGKDATTTVAGPATFTPVRGQALTVFAVVAPKAPGSGTPTGTVTFKVGPAVLATVPVVTQGGQTFAQWTSAPLGLRTYTITTVYNGDSGDLGSAASTTFTVGPDSTAMNVGPSDFAPVRGESLAINAIVSVKSPGAGAPTGTVTFKFGSAVLATEPIVSANGLTYARLPAVPFGLGSYTITAVYNGDAGDQPSMGTTTFTVGPDATTTIAGPSILAPVSGQALSLNAIVAVNAPGSGTPTGTVTFKSGSKVIGTATLRTVNGLTYASLLLSTLGPGTYTFTAIYGGDAGDQTSTGTTTFTVASAPANGGSTRSAFPALSGRTTAVVPTGPMALVSMPATRDSWKNPGRARGLIRNFAAARLFGA